MHTRLRTVLHLSATCFPISGRLRHQMGPPAKKYNIIERPNALEYLALKPTIDVPMDSEKINESLLSPRIRRHSQILER